MRFYDHSRNKIAGSPDSMISLEDSDHAKLMLASLDATLDSMVVGKERRSSVTSIDFLFGDLSFDSAEDVSSYRYDDTRTTYGSPSLLGPVASRFGLEMNSSSPPILLI
jgi:hypothetical protein